jgi:hypothetical protein
MGSLRFSSFVDQVGKPLEPAELVVGVSAHPLLQFLKRLRPQGIDSSLAVGADADESSLVQDAQVARHAGLANVYFGYDLVYRAFTPVEYLHHSAAHGVREDDKDV